MTPETLTRTFPFRVRPSHLETLDSFTRRTLSANGEPKRLHRDLMALAREFDANATWMDVLATKTGRSLSHMSVAPTSGLHDQCAPCAALLTERWACLLCSRGEEVQQHPHLETFLCERHARWTGPDTSVEAQHKVSIEQVSAHRRFRRLRRRGELDVPLLVDVLEALTDDFDAAPSAVFHHAVAVAAWVTRRDTLRRLFDPDETHAGTFEWMRTSLTALTQMETPQAARAIWLRLWPAHVALQSSFRGYTGYHSGHLHDLTLPADILDWYPRPTTLQTARDYFACTGDDQLSAFAKNGTRVATCRRGHDYVDVVVTADPRDRTPCPTCTAAHVEQGVNDLATVAPDIAAQLHPTLNGNLQATEIAAASSHRVWWRCANNHPFIATPSNRTQTGAGCGVCLNRTLISGVNDFATLHPFMALQLQRPSMSSKRANQLSADDAKMRDWVCPDGHPFRSTIKKRVSTRGTCPECQKERRRKSRNNFANTHPDKARTWLPELNDGRRPDEYTKGSKLDVIWWCERGQHKFEMRLEARSRGCDCPYCAGRRILPGFNDFATTHPDLAVDWHPYLNWKQPTEVMAGSIEKFYWKCRHGDITHQSIPKRRLSGGCVDCPRQERAGSRHADAAVSAV